MKPHAACKSLLPLSVVDGVEASAMDLDLIVWRLRALGAPKVKDLELFVYTLQLLRKHNAWGV